MASHMQIYESKINKKNVKKMDIPSVPPEKVKGGDIIGELYANIFILSKKKSGKTFIVRTILNECSGPNTIIFLFVSTHMKDPAWEQIKQEFSAKGIQFHAFVDIREGKENYLEKVKKDLDSKFGKGIDGQSLQKDPYSEAKMAIDSFDKSVSHVVRFGPPERIKHAIFTGEEAIAEEEEAEKRPRAPRKIAPEYIFVFDDMGDQLRVTAVAAFLKKNRHYRCKCIISSQWYSDLMPSAKKQIDYFILLPEIPDDSLLNIYKIANITIPIDGFLKLYKHVTMHKYNFLMIDTVNHQFRHNFNKLIDLRFV